MAAVYFSLIWLAGASAIYWVTKGLVSRLYLSTSADSFHWTPSIFSSHVTVSIRDASLMLMEDFLFLAFMLRLTRLAHSSPSTVKPSATKVPSRPQKARSATAKAAG